MKRIILFSFLLLSLSAYSSGKHDSHNEKEGHTEAHEEKHGKEHAQEHDDHDDHDKEKGFKLTDKAQKKFGLQYSSVKNSSLEIPKEAIFRGLNEVNLYRLREGFYKRVDFKILEEKKDSVTISSSDLKAGDQIVTSGLGFLRIAEIAASGGISDSHSH